MKPEKMLLADALKTAIESRKENIKLKKWLIGSLALNWLLLAVIWVIL